jgi:hypothetical protein
MLPLRDDAILSVGGATYLGSDLVRAAQRWGDWAKLENQIRQGLACVARAEDTGDDVQDEELQAAASEFRYDRDLISGQEMEVWLARWSIDADDWMEYLRRRLLSERWATELLTTVARYPVRSEDIEEALRVEAICSGFLARTATKLAARAGAAARAREEGWLEEEAHQVDADTVLERVDVGFGRFCEGIVTEAALAAQLAAHRLDWIRMECRRLALPTLESAREAALCVREDGMDLDEVARSAGARVEVVSDFLENWEPALRGPLLAARTVDLLGPMESESGFLLVLVREKVLPSLQDPAVRRRATDQLLEAALAQEADSRVVWHVPELAKSTPGGWTAP